MSAYTKLLEEVGKGVASTAKPIQDLTVSAVTAAADAAGSIIPSFPLPLVDRLPTAKEIVDANFALIQRVIDVQREFAAGLADAVAPVAGKVRSNGSA